ncbi:FMN-binding negative transcriptional regulator [Kitasatospora sp. NPDC056076]|uniref:FMN-binding negative transcriptional regulator n=1 Tax=Kitasatospora sp. NPDC056076 TaxID=3345703 RepID=UPI0035D5ED16
MFTPKLYQVDGDDWPLRVIERHPLAVLTGNGNPTPNATHVPVIVPPDAAPGDPLQGMRLWTHMTRVNPHWQQLVADGGGPAKLVFHGPNGYVTPTLYSAPMVAPTWNYVAVHLEGTIELAADDETLTIVHTTAQTLEDRFGDGMPLAPSLEYHRQIVGAVGGIHFTVTKVEVMFKLSQEKDPEVQQRVLDRFAGSDSGLHREVADTMRALRLGADER